MTVPSFDEAAGRLLTVVDGLPVRHNERDRLIRALDIVASAEWTRVLVKLSADQVDCLRRADLLFAPNELAHVLGVAQSLAQVFGFDHTGIPHIAVALVLTCRFDRPIGVGMANMVAEAFGLGHLEQPGKAVDHYLIGRENGPEVDPDEFPGIYLAGQGERCHRIASVLHLLVRVGAAVGLAYLVAVHRHSLWLWLLAFLVLIGTRDSRDTPLHLGQEVGPFRLRLRWPLTAGLVVLAGVLGEQVAGWILLGSLLATNTVAYLGEAITARQHRFYESEVAGFGPPVLRIAAIPESFGTRRRCVRLVPTLVAATSVLFVTVDPLYVLVTVLVAWRLAGAAAVVVGFALLLTFQPWSALVAVAGGLAARAAIAYIQRPPRPVLPFAAKRQQMRARRLISRDRAGAALALLGSPETPYERVLRGWALLQTGRPGEAKAVVATLPDEWRSARGLIVGLTELDLGNQDRALAVLNDVRLPRGRTRWRRAFRAQHGIAKLRAMAPTHTSPEFTETIARALPDSVARDNLLPTLALLRLAAETTLKPAPPLSSLISAAAYLLAQWALDFREAQWYELLGNQRTLDLEIARCVALIHISDLRAGKTDSWDVELLGSHAGVANVLLRLDRPLEAASVLNMLADHLETTPHRLAALDSRVEALAVLQWTRHRMSDLDERRLWWSAAVETLHRTMRQAAAGQDWALLAELIESARLQVEPGQESGPVTVAPFIRIHGISRMEAASWYQADERPPAYALEDMASYVHGPGTWWWSTWAVGDRLYWAVLPPEGEVSGGFLALGSSSSLNTALADLRDALPVPYPGEVPGSDEFNLRIEQGVLCGPLDAETSLARRLGEMLPSPLRAQLRITHPELRLAIAPAQPLANVPWAIVGLPDETLDVRLVERAHVVVAPPAALLTAVAEREVHDQLPLKLAVLNPGGVRAKPEEQLPAADTLAEVVPPNVTTVTAEDVLTVEKFGAVLQGVPAGASAVFACHTHPGNGTPLSGGLLIRPDEPPGILMVRELITAPQTYPIPEQALVLACESADLRQAASGEWLVLGPALLWAGARRLVVTSYPIPDDDVVDRALIDALVQGQDLVTALRAVQLDRLNRWRDSAGEDAFPVTWGGHIALGSFGHAILQVVSGRPERFVSQAVVELVDSAARYALMNGRSAVTYADVFRKLVWYGYEKYLPVGRKLLVGVGRFTWNLPNLLRKQLAEPAGTVTLDAGVVQLLQAATDLAATARHKVIHTEHLLVAMLAASGRRAAIARWLSHWDGRQPEVLKELTDETQDNLQFVELPAVRRLSPEAVTALYDACSVQVPESGEKGRLINEL